jgi:hypothetical protein
MFRIHWFDALFFSDWLRDVLQDVSIMCKNESKGFSVPLTILKCCWLGAKGLGLLYFHSRFPPRKEEFCQQLLLRYKDRPATSWCGTNPGVEVRSDAPQVQAWMALTGLINSITNLPVRGICSNVSFCCAYVNLEQLLPMWRVNPNLTGNHNSYTTMFCMADQGAWLLTWHEKLLKATRPILKPLVTVLILSAFYPQFNAACFCPTYLRLAYPL